MDAPPEPLESGSAHGGSWYDRADLYDIAFSWNTDDEIRGLEAILGRHGVGAEATIYEPFCGGGRLVLPLVRRGFRVVGADLNSAMLDVARRKLDALGVSGMDPKRFELFHADVSEFSPPACDAVVTLIDSFRHLHAPGQALRALERWRKACPRGPIIVGLELGNASVRGGPPEPASWTQTRDGVKVSVCVQTDLPHEGLQLMRVRLDAALADGSLYRIEDESMMAFYDFGSFRALARASGLDVVECLEWNGFGRRENVASEGNVVAVLRAQEALCAEER
ncbi:MAG: class I SAM-dependent methyltransferase [Planctomycetota bacterium]|nr:class I SAM-dependent methyltransferase [Planctomycetota bacterium]